jgi:uncharacterized protein
MSDYKTPGVYIEEIVKFPPSIAAVDTAIPVFIGYTEKAIDPRKGPIPAPKRITTMFEYIAFFGEPFQETGIIVTIEGQTVKAAIIEEQMSKFKMYHSLQLFFANGGGPCYIYSVGTYESTGGVILMSNLSDALEETAKIDEITLILFPDALALTPMKDYYDLHKEAMDLCELLKDRFVIMDVYSNNEPVEDSTELRDNLSGPENVLKYGAVYYPKIKTSLDYQFKDEVIIVKIDGVDTTLAAIKATDNARYFKSLNEIRALEVMLPASVGVAGVYASVDSQRGVWKAPANVNIDLVSAPFLIINDKQQENLNVDSKAGKSINVIRSFSGRGSALIWGSRTLAGNSNEWRYVPVRRYFNMVEESIKNATFQFVFEPNDINTWVRVKSMIANFLMQQWKAGALMGVNPEQAFFVHVGLNQTMSFQDILEGRMIVEIGLAVVRPAEFIILKFSHKMLEES